MNSIRISKICMENFKCFKHKEIDLGGLSATISGRNATGKTTVMDAVNWALFNKMADGSAPNKIRPHDNEGKDINYIDISVKLDLVVNDEPLSLKKTSKQKWTKPRGKAEAEYGGNINEYEINGVPLDEKRYKARIDEIISEEVFRFASNGNAFLRLSTKERRAKLFELVAGFSYKDVLKGDETLAELDEVLSRNSYDEAMLMCTRELKRLNETIKNIPIRIDELVKGRVAGDMETLKAKAAFAREQLASADGKDIAADIAELQQQKTRIIMDAENDFRTRMTEAKREQQEAGETCQSMIVERYRINNELHRNTKKLAELETELKEAREKYKEIDSEECTIEKMCPTCGQRLPIEDLERAFQNFDTSKKRRLDSVTETGNQINAEIESVTTRNAALKIKAELLETKLAEAEAVNKRLVDRLKAMKRDDVDTTEIDMKIAAKNKLLKETAAGKIDEYTNMLVEIERQMSKLESNAEIDKRIEKLSEQRDELSQEIANTEKMQYLLEEYNRKRVCLLTDKINEHFTIVKWQLFKNQINGGLQDVCEATVNGSIVGNGLNYGHSILASLDICQTMQKIYDTEVPIFLDNMEALSSDTAAQVAGNCQIISLAVSDTGLEVKLHE